MPSFIIIKRISDYTSIPRRIISSSHRKKKIDYGLKKDQQQQQQMIKKKQVTFDLSRLNPKNEYLLYDDDEDSETTTTTTTENDSDTTSTTLTTSTSTPPPYFDDDNIDDESSNNSNNNIWYSPMDYKKFELRDNKLSVLLLDSSKKNLSSSQVERMSGHSIRGLEYCASVCGSKIQFCERRKFAVTAVLGAQYCCRNNAGPNSPHTKCRKKGLLKQRLSINNINNKQKMILQHPQEGWVDEVIANAYKPYSEFSTKLALQRAEDDEQYVIQNVREKTTKNE